MAYYLIQVTYTPEAWAAQLKNPQNRLETLRGMLEPLGTSIDHMWYSFGEYDVVLIAQADGNIDAAAAVLSAAAGGAVKSLRTTPLMTIAEGIEAMTKAGSLGYEPPSSG